MTAVSEILTKIEALCGEDGRTRADLSVRLDALAAQSPDPLDWRSSVVDLMKLLDVDASYGARKQMAIEMGYPEERILTHGSAEMNIWLRTHLEKEIFSNEKASEEEGNGSDSTQGE